MKPRERYIFTEDVGKITLFCDDDKQIAHHSHQHPHNVTQSQNQEEGLSSAYCLGSLNEKCTDKIQINTNDSTTLTNALAM